MPEEKNMTILKVFQKEKFKKQTIVLLFRFLIKYYLQITVGQDNCKVDRNILMKV